ncbi:helix-turn-helix domain-containing protein [Streptomyces sp. NPDC001700]
METDIVSPGANVARLRKDRGWGQDYLARRAGMSKSQLGKIERGECALSQVMGAALATVFGITLDELLKPAPVPAGDEDSLNSLRATIRRFDLPQGPPDEQAALEHEVAELLQLRDAADLKRVTHKLPDVLSRAQESAHATGQPQDWGRVADVYSTVYWLAARHRWMTLAELAVARQKQASERADALSLAIAARDEAGTFLNGGDFAGGLAVIDRAVVMAETTLRGRDRHIGLGILHLRGMTLAGRLRDVATAQRHIEAAWHAAELVGTDLNVRGMLFGPDNTATHVIATETDTEQYREAVATAADLFREGTALPPTRIGPTHMNVSRAKLALKDRDGALDSLADAWDVVPSDGQGSSHEPGTQPRPYASAQAQQPEAQQDRQEGGDQAMTGRPP